MPGYPVDLSILAKLEPDTLRALMPQFLAGFITEPQVSADNLARIGPPIAEWTDAEAKAVLDSLSTLGEEEILYRANPHCRQLARLWSEAMISRHTLQGVEHLRAAAEAGPTVVLCNHQAYFDSTAIDAILTWEGHADLADRLFSAAGPKVYTDFFRRVASSGLNTLPVPQSTSFSHTAQMSARELARKAISSLKTAGAALDEGMVLLIYPEGSRTRTGQLGPFLKGVHRYLGIREGLRVVPAALIGTAAIMPVGETQLRAAPAHLSFGIPLQVGPDLPQREALQAAHQAISELLVPKNEPVLQTPINP